MITNSTAYPPGDDGVLLTARVHKHLESDEGVDDICYSTSVSWDELDEVRALHTEWFPVAYHEDFFQSIVTGTGFGGGDVVTVVATMGENPRYIVGMITIAIRRAESQYNPAADLSPYLGLPTDSTAAYILTLGVVDELRGKGIGRRLLDLAIRKVEETDHMCRLVFLHVIEYNEAARKFYLREKFLEFKKYSEFYFFDGKVFDGMLLYKLVGNDSEVKGVWQVTRWLYKKMRELFGSIFTVKRPRKDDDSSLV